MSDQRDGGIAWCDETWNPIRGCTRVSPGCENCYAERVAARFSDSGLPFEGLARRGKNGPRWTGEVRMVPEHLADPLKWKRPRRVFVNSVSDLFHEKLTNEQIAAVFGVMAASPQHTFQVLTKRPERMVEWFKWIDDGDASPHTMTMREAVCWLHREPAWHRAVHDVGLDVELPECEVWPLANVWLGVTAEDQQRADERIPLLLQTPAAVRFVSVEPQLGPVDLSPYLAVPRAIPDDPHATFLLGEAIQDGLADAERALGWVITGAESGPGARPYDLAWARSLRDQCASAGVAYFLKQIIVDGKKVSTPALDGVVHAEFPR